MNDFPSPSKEHIGGLKIFRFIPVEDVISLPETQELDFFDMELQPGAVWYNALAAYQSISHTDQLNQSPHGDYFSNEVNAFYPGTSRELEALFGEMINRRFLVRTKDYDGNERLIGTLEDPLTFERTFGSSRPGERKGYGLSFKNQQRSQSYFYNDIAGPGAIQINDDGKIEVVESVEGHTFSLNSDGQLTVTGPFDYKFYLNAQGEVVFDEFITA